MECSQPNCIIVITILWVKICLLELWKLLFWCGCSIFGFSGIVFCIVLWCEYRMFCQALYCVVDGGYRIISQRICYAVVQVSQCWLRIVLCCGVVVVMVAIGIVCCYGNCFQLVIGCCGVGIRYRSVEAFQSPRYYVIC